MEIRGKRKQWGALWWTPFGSSIVLCRVRGYRNMEVLFPNISIVNDFRIKCCDRRVNSFSFTLLVD